jgi:transposase
MELGVLGAAGGVKEAAKHKFSPLVDVAILAAASNRAVCLQIPEPRANGVSATVYEKEVLRCNLCGKTFTAPTPEEAGASKYAPGVGVMVSLLRYGSGMPHYRLEQFQRSLGVPLPAGTQWELVQEVARAVEPVADHLAWLAAQAPGLHNDDTTMRVGELRRQIQSETDPERTGIFTSGIVANAPQHPIALFFTGRAHAGENLDQLLRERSGQLPPSAADG